MTVETERVGVAALVLAVTRSRLRERVSSPRSAGGRPSVGAPRPFRASLSEARSPVGALRYHEEVSPSTKALLVEALSLEESERASLAGALIESLHPPVAAGIEAAWDVEIERRVRELKEGRAQTIPWSEVRAQLFRGFE